MRIAVLNDAHGNLPAVKAALTTIRALGCNATYHTGNAVGIGPYPAECVEHLLWAATTKPTRSISGPMMSPQA